MQKVSVCLLLATVRSGLSLRRAPGHEKLASSADEVCTLDAPASDFYSPLAFAFPDDAHVSQFLTAAEQAEAKEVSPTEAERKEWKEAMKEFGTAQQQMQKSQKRLMAAMEAMLEVPNVNGTSLAALVEKKEKDLLVVFYAPWCPHCQRYVLHDGQGQPEKAPLELFNREMQSSGANATLTVVRFDTARDQNVPEGFEVKYIPTIYVAAANGKKTQYKGNPQDTKALVAFIEANSAKTTKIGAASSNSLV